MVHSGYLGFALLTGVGVEKVGDTVTARRRDHGPA
jgi:hypothetical protein